MTKLQERSCRFPVRAGLAHYQCVTIHPYYDENARTAQLLTAMILRRCGYGLKGIDSLDECYARPLGGYCEALAVGPSHNYPFRSGQGWVSGFVEYLCKSMAYALLKVRTKCGEFGTAPAGKTAKSCMVITLTAQTSHAATLDSCIQ